MPVRINSLKAFRSGLLDQAKSGLRRQTQNMDVFLYFGNGNYNLVVASNFLSAALMLEEDGFGESN